MNADSKDAQARLIAGIALVPQLEPQSLASAIATLAPKALRGTGPAFMRHPEIAEYLRKQLESNPPVPRHGVLLLAAPVPDLKEPRIALGTSSHGIDPPSIAQGRIHVLFLYLHLNDGRPMRLPALAEKLCAEKIAYNLSSAEDSAAIVHILRTM